MFVGITWTVLVCTQCINIGHTFCYFYRRKPNLRKDRVYLMLCSDKLTTCWHFHSNIIRRLCTQNPRMYVNAQIHIKTNCISTLLAVHVLTHIVGSTGAFLGWQWLIEVVLMRWDTWRRWLLLSSTVWSASSRQSSNMVDSDRIAKEWYIFAFIINCNK